MNFRSFCCITIAAFSYANVNAQISEGGKPLSMDPNYAEKIVWQYVPQNVLDAPDIEALKKEDVTPEFKAKRLYRIGSVVNSDISFPDAGVFVTLDDGRQVWRAQISMPGALAMGLYYDRFQLPDGVKMYLTNENKKQVLGAYTSAANPDDGLWANEKVQGSLINIELDIDADVDVNKIQMHINEVADFYHSINYLASYTTTPPPPSPTTPTDPTDPYFAPSFEYGGSSPCEINAICPLGNGFPNQRKGSVHIEYKKNPDIYAGSGTMMNNTKQDCTPYMLTASHIESTNSTANSTFSTWIIYFNYETPTCNYTGTQPAGTNTITGATFRARSSYNASSNKIVGDFLLLELKKKAPLSFGTYLIGWNIATSLPVGQFIGFHHPSGDVKKVSVTNLVLPNGSFNGGQANSHWELTWTQGGIEEGSSGSGLFDPNGRLIGDLTGGAVLHPPCPDTNNHGEKMSDLSEYSKISLNWLYTYQSPSSAATRLKDWLDPNNSGATTLNVLSGDCVLSVEKVASDKKDIKVYPNPVKDVAYIDVDAATKNVNIEVFDVVGHALPSQYQSVAAGKYAVDLSNQTTGIYILRITADNTVITRKITVAK